MLRSVLKSVLHNVFVVAVGFVVALLGAAIDHLLGIADFKGALADGLGCALIAAGFLLRTWAAFHFYMRGMDSTRNSISSRRERTDSPGIPYTLAGTCLSSAVRL